MKLDIRSPAPVELPIVSPGVSVSEALVELADYLRSKGYRFTTITPETHRRVLARDPNRLAASLRDIFGWSMTFHPSVLPAALFDLLTSAAVVVPSAKGWRSCFRFSSRGDLLLVHSAYPTSHSDSVFFGPDSYRFADALERHIDSLEGTVRRALDIGCGTGIGGLVIARAFPEAVVTLSDINEAALRLARINASQAKVSNVVFCLSDLLKSIRGEFDLIVSNPPYLVDPGQRTYRNGGGRSGTELSQKIVDAATTRLAPGGSILLYTGTPIRQGIDQFRVTAGQRLDKFGFEWFYHEVDPDVFGEELESPSYVDFDRIAAVVLSGTKPR